MVHCADGETRIDPELSFVQVSSGKFRISKTQESSSSFNANFCVVRMLTQILCVFDNLVGNFIEALTDQLKITLKALDSDLFRPLGSYALNTRGWVPEIKVPDII